jgi:hypothetical protein
MSLQAALGNLRDLPKKEYEAMCHCTTIKYTVKIPELEPPTSHPVLLCNCSICVKAGYLLIYPLKEDVVFTQGKEHLKEYKAYGGQAPHYFCDICGSSLYIDHPDNMHPSGNNVYCVSVGIGSFMATFRAHVA